MHQIPPLCKLLKVTVVVFDGQIPAAEAEEESGEERDGSELHLDGSSKLEKQMRSRQEKQKERENQL